MASLQKSGDSEWRRRVQQSSESDNPSESGSVDPAGSSKPTSIADRMRLLATAEEGWRKRVNEASTKDANRFTVAGKMGKWDPSKKKKKMLKDPQKIPEMLSGTRRDHSRDWI